MITLYGVTRSRTLRCLWVLEELGIPFEHVPTNFDAACKTPEFLAINPNGHIPALRDGDVTLCESLAINLYLARKHDQGLWPKTVADEGRTFQWSTWAMTELEEPLITAMANRILLPEAERDPAKLADAQRRAAKPIGVLESALASRAWLAGDDFTVADLNVAAVLSWAKLAKVDLTPFPTVGAWLERCTGRPALARAMAR